MKRLAILLSVALVLSGCYEDYVYDYLYSGVYIANQYDLRSFVVGEDDCMSIQFGAVLGGVIDNAEPRNVYYLPDDYLVNGDLSIYGSSHKFTSFDGMMGNAPFGKLSQPYVSEAVNAAGISRLEPLPSAYYSLSAGKICIDTGANTGTVTLELDKEMALADENFGVNPYYAFAYRITDADADTVLTEKSFSIIALRLENTLFGCWYHGGKSEVVDDASSQVLSSSSYPTTIPCEETLGKIYNLVSDTPNSVRSDYFHNAAGSLVLSPDGQTVHVSDKEGRVQDLGSSWNNPKYLQDRKIFLNYRYSNGDGTSTVVTDTLTFRNRIRDGVSEWQSERI